MPIEDNEYVPRTRETIREQQASDLQTQQPNANPNAPSTYTYALQYALAATIAQQQEQDLQELYESAYVRDATGEELTKKAENLGVIRSEGQRATGVIRFKRTSNAPEDFTIPSGTIVETLEENSVQFETTEQVTLASGTQEVAANIIALERGNDGNVGPDSIQAIPDKPTGVDTVNNPNAVGDPTLTDTNGDPLRQGRNRETDAQLRERVFDTEAVQEAPSEPGIGKALERIPGVESQTMQINATDGVVNGLDPYHSEVIVFGGDARDIAETLRDVLSVTTLLRLQGGVSGTGESVDIEAELLDQVITVPFTRPEERPLEPTLEVVHNEQYAGENAVKDAIVSYIGGTYTDGSTTTGLGIGETVLVNQVENACEDLAGVEYAEILDIDFGDDGDIQDDTTEDSDGVPVLEIGETEISRVDASDIALYETAR